MTRRSAASTTTTGATLATASSSTGCGPAASRRDAALDEWLKDAAPSTELRRWYGHDPGQFVEFSRRYRAELRQPPASDAVDHLIGLAATYSVILLTATGDVEHSGARVLQDQLRLKGARWAR